MISVGSLMKQRDFSIESGSLWLDMISKNKSQAMYVVTKAGNYMRCHELSAPLLLGHCLLEMCACGRLLQGPLNVCEFTKTV